MTTRLNENPATNGVNHSNNQLNSTINDGFGTGEIENKIQPIVRIKLTLADEFEATNDNMQDWPDPLPLPEKAALLPVQPFTKELLPKVLQDYVEDVAHLMECKMDGVAASIMVTLSSLIGARCSIRPKRFNNRWLVVPNLWGGICGNPSTKKTPVMNAATLPLKILEAESRAIYKDQLATYEKECGLNKIAKDAFKKEIATSSKNGVVSEEHRAAYMSQDEIKKPIWKRYKTHNTTIEKMGEILSENPTGVLYFSDELPTILKNWGKAGHEQDRPFYLQSWSGDSEHTNDTLSRGSTHNENLCISLLGSIQPSILRSYVEKAITGTENDGLIQRFQLLMYPDNEENSEPVDAAPNEEAEKTFLELAKKIDIIDFIEFGALQMASEARPYFHFDDEAQEVFNEWNKELLNKMRENDGNIMEQHLSKYPSLMPSIALILHVVDLASGKSAGQVSKSAAIKAAAWCDLLESHARRIYSLGMDRIPSILALEKIISSNSITDGFTVRDVYRKELANLSRKEDAKFACEELVKHGWLREKVTEPAFKQKGKTTYLINPKIFSLDE